MAQTKKRRRRKRRGTQGGRIDRRPSRGRPRSRAEAQARAKSRGKKKSTGPRVPQPASWSSAFKKGGIAAALFLAVILLIGQSPAQAAFVAVFMLGFYVPLAFTMDSFMYNRHLRKEAKKQMEREQARRGPTQPSEGG